MFIQNVNTGIKANYAINGTNLTLTVPNVGAISVDLQAKQRDVDRIVDVSLTQDFKNLGEGVGSWYVATINIPAVETRAYETGETDDEGNPVIAETTLPLDMNKVTLYLWGLPENIIKEDVEGGNE